MEGREGREEGDMRKGEREGRANPHIPCISHSLDLDVLREVGSDSVHMEEGGQPTRCKQGNTTSVLCKQT